MEKIFLDGETYYFNKGIIYDSSFLETPTIITQKVLKKYYSNINYIDFEEEKLLEYLKQLKVSGFYELCLNVINYGLDKFSASFDFCREEGKKSNFARSGFRAQSLYSHSACPVLNPGIATGEYDGDNSVCPRHPTSKHHDFRLQHFRYVFGIGAWGGGFRSAGR